MSKALEMAKELVRMLEEQENVQDCENTNCSDKVELSTLNAGDLFKIGEHDFVVLEQSEGKTSVISKRFMAEDVVFDENSKDYNTSNLKKVIESDIQPIIEKYVGAENIVEQEVDLTSVDMQTDFNACKCKVRPVTFDEARKYNDLLVNEKLNDWWWTCTPWSTEKRGTKYSIAVVSSSGRFNYGVYVSYRGVRPFCILKSNIFVSRGV
jgi:hypothetical protein